MKNILLARFLSSVSLLLFFTTASAVVNSPSDNDASVVHLQTSCVVNNSEIANCFDNLPNLLDWTWSVRHPSATSPLLVDIGPGIFYGKPDGAIGLGNICKDDGHVTFRGSGRENTTLRANPASLPAGFTVHNCNELAFQDLTIDGANAVYGLFWSGNGSSSYSNIELTGADLVWYDDNCTSNGLSRHYFSGSKITALSEGPSSNAVAYFSRCAETWFLGSEITARAPANQATMVTTILAETGEIHVYGSVVRALAEPGASSDSINAITANNPGAEIHLHGTGIDVISEAGNNVIALSASNGGRIHASQSSFVLKTNGGTRTRLSNNGGTILAPYIWEDTSTLPDIISEHGSDMAFTTDNADGQPHIVIYSDNCASKWFDSTLNTCR